MSMPKSVVIDLVDSLTSYHCPYQVQCTHGKYGPRRRRQHRAWTCRSRQATRFTPPSAAATHSQTTGRCSLVIIATTTD